MDYYTIIGMVASALIAVVSFYATQKRAMKDDMQKEAEAHEKSAKELQALNENIIKLNVNFENMLQNDQVRDKRIEKHGKEIDDIIERQRDNEHILANHEGRIKSLEVWRGEKTRGA